MGDEKVYQSPNYFYCVAYILFRRPFSKDKYKNIIKSISEYNIFHIDANFDMTNIVL
jgi:hypothetical protein